MKYTAKHYAEALRASAESTDAFRHLIADLASVVEHVVADKGIRSFFTNATIAPAEQERVIRETFKDFLSAQTYAFLRTLLANRQFALLERIVAAAEQIADTVEGTSRALVESAVPLSEKVRSQIEGVLTALLERRVLVTYEESPALVAGFRLTVDGSTHWDGTISGKLQRLQEHLRDI